ncbi:MAG: NTPase [Candidatus Bathyarchaeia archaeon]
MKKRLLFITGVPGIGKTTVLLKTVKSLKALEYSVGGMISREVRKGGMRVGFEILDLAAEKSGWLAHVNHKAGPKVGKYGVNIEDLNRVGVSAILHAIENCDVVAIDEVGPMELYSEKFREAVWKAVESSKLVIGTIHWKAKDKLIDMVKTREDAEIFTVTYENRDRLHQSIIERIKRASCKSGFGKTH